MAVGKPIMLELDLTHAARLDRHPLSAAWGDLRPDEYRALVASLKVEAFFPHDLRF